MDRPQNLKMTAKKPLDAASKRLKCLMISLMQYHVAIKYKPVGPEMYLTDTLSREYLPQQHYPGKADQEVERIHSMDFLNLSHRFKKSMRKLPQIL